MTSPLLTELANVSNTSLSEIGAIFTFNTIGYLIFSNLCGFVSSRINQKKFLSFVIILYSVFILLITYSTTTLHLYTTMFFIGGGSGSVMSLLTAYIDSLNKNGAYDSVNKVHLNFGIGAIFGPILVTLFAEMSLEWKYIYIVISALLFILGVIFNKAQYLENSNLEKMELKEVKNIVTNRSIIIIAICIALYNGAEVGSWGWLSTNLKSQNVSIIQSNLAVSMFWIFMTIGRKLTTKLTNKYKLTDVLNMLLIFSIISNILINLNFGGIYNAVFISLIGLSYSSICPLLITLGFDKLKVKNQAYTVSSILLSSGSLGIMIIPYLMGVNSKIGIYIPTIALIICALTLNLGLNKKKTYVNI